jgi:hypothetical protein
VLLWRRCIHAHKENTLACSTSALQDDVSIKTKMWLRGSLEPSVTCMILLHVSGMNYKLPNMYNCSKYEIVLCSEYMCIYLDTFNQVVHSSPRICVWLNHKPKEDDVQLIGGSSIRTGLVGCVSPLIQHSSSHVSMERGQRMQCCK